MKSEAAVQREVVRYLKALGAVVYRVGQRDARGTQDPGVSDIIAFHGGRCFFLEVKSATGKQSHAQRGFEAAVALAWAHGVVRYAVVRSLADVERVLGNNGPDNGNG